MQCNIECSLHCSVSIAITDAGKRNIPQWKGVLPQKSSQGKEEEEEAEYKWFPPVETAPGWVQVKIQIPSACVGPLQVSLFHSRDVGDVGDAQYFLFFPLATSPTWRKPLLTSVADFP